MASDNDYKEAVSVFEGQLRELQVGKSKVVRENWNDLMLRSKGKKSK